MSLELFRKIIQQVAPLTEQVCFHLMGDPLVHPKLDEMVSICGEFNVKIFFVTNGLLMREKQTELLLSPALRQVNFSLHSFPDNFPDRDPVRLFEPYFCLPQIAPCTSDLICISTIGYGICKTYAALRIKIWKCLKKLKNILKSVLIPISMCALKKVFVKK